MSHPTSIPQLTIAECARISGVSQPTVRRFIADGQLKAYKIGRSIRIAEADFAALYAQIPAYGVSHD